MKTKSLVTLLFLVSTGACTYDRSALHDSTKQSSPVDLVDSDWIIAVMNGQPVLAGSRVTLNFDSAALGGYSGCNWYGTRYSVKESAITVEQIGGTARACVVPAGVMEQEQTFYRTLERARSFSIDKDSLTLRDSASAVLLQLWRREKLAMKPRDLVDTKWVLIAIDGAQFRYTPSVTLAFGDSATLGFGGCRDYKGTYRANGDEIRFTSIEMGALECKRGLAAQRREENFTTDLSETSHYRLTVDSLFLFTFPGRVIGFRRDR